MSERRLLKLCVFGVTATLTACLTACSLVPKLVRPEAPVPDAFPMQAATLAPSVQQPLAADLLWQDFFKDAQLKRLITLALANNRDLRVAVLNIEQMRAQYQIRSADQYPSISAVASAARTPETSGGTSSSYSVGLAVTAYELDLFGRISSLKDVALSQYLATQEGAAAVRISLIATVANTYLSLLANEELLLLTRQTLRTRDESKKLTQLRFDNGVSSELDLRLAESLTEAARVVDAQQQRQRALDENALALLVGQSIKNELPNAATRPPLAQALLLAQVPAGLPSDMLLSRPDIRQVEQLLVASNANIGAARAAFFPRIALTMGVGTLSGQMAGLFDSGSWAWSMAPQLLMPIFDAGRNQAGLEAARAGQGIAVAQYEKVIQSAFREVADALTTRSTLVDQLMAQSAQSEAEAKRFTLAELRYQNGVSSYLDLLDAQRSLFAAQQGVVQTRLAQLQSQVTLYKALGGGWKDMSPAANPVAAPN